MYIYIHKSYICIAIVSSSTIKIPINQPVDQGNARWRNVRCSKARWTRWLLCGFGQGNFPGISWKQDGAPVG